jgi:N-acetylmuramoyl-L-alanine amidase
MFGGGPVFVDKKKITRLILPALFLLLVAASPAYAAITGFVAKDDNGNYYEYSYDELLDSYAWNILGISNGLYEDFASKRLHALLNSTGGYIDYKDIVDNYASALLRDESFDPHLYAESATAKRAQMPSTVSVVKLASGKIALAEKNISSSNTGTNPGTAVPTEKTEIKGAAQVSLEQAQLWAVSRQAHQRFIDIAALYWDYGQNTGIRPEVLYAQAAIETNFGKYDSHVPPEYNNWAGIKIAEAQDNTIESHEQFVTAEEGVRAHFNHMSAYLGLTPYGEPHARYHVVAAQSWAGSVIHLEDLSGKWTSALDYHVYILTILEQIYQTELPSPNDDGSDDPGSDHGVDNYERNVAVNVDILRLRGGPGTEYDILDRLVRGTVLTVSDSQDEWLSVTAPDNKNGWVHGDYVVPVETAVDVLKGKIIVVDPGHGGSDPGAIGVTGLREKIVNLAVSKHLITLLSGAGAEVIVTRTGDQSVSNQQRVDLANGSKADLYMSIHSNAYSNPESNGTETHYCGKNGSSSASRYLAQQVQRELVPALGLRDRGVKANSFFVITNVEMPAALVELGFMTNPIEEAFLGEPANQLLAAEALYRGIEAYLHQVR